MARKLSTQSLAALCRRLSLALGSGQEARGVWQREASRARGSQRRVLEEIAASVAAGHSISVGLECCADVFPPLFRELVAVGEQTGHLTEVFDRLAVHYEERALVRRNFLGSLIWPSIQLAAALAVIGLLIWVTGIINTGSDADSFDLLGLGLSGTRGLTIYVSLLAVLGITAIVIVKVALSGALWVGPVQQFVFRLPVIGSCLRAMALGNFCWALGLSMQAGMDVRRAMPLALRTTQTAVYQRHTEAISKSVDNGDSVLDALTPHGDFPPELLDIVAVGESTGQLPESLLRHSGQLQQQASAQLRSLAIISGFLVWASVALMIAVIVIRVVASYANFIHELAAPP